jgi:hypothetical protein
MYHENLYNYRTLIGHRVTLEEKGNHKYKDIIIIGRLEAKLNTILKRKQFILWKVLPCVHFIIRDRFVTFRVR